MHTIAPEDAAREKAAATQLAINVAALNGKLSPRGISVDLADSKRFPNYKRLAFLGDAGAHAELLARAGVGLDRDKLGRYPDVFSYEHLPSECVRFTANFLASL